MDLSLGLRLGSAALRRVATSPFAISTPTDLAVVTPVDNPPDFTFSLPTGEMQDGDIVRLQFDGTGTVYDSNEVWNTASPPSSWSWTLPALSSGGHFGKIRVYGGPDNFSDWSAAANFTIAASMWAESDDASNIAFWDASDAASIAVTGTDVTQVDDNSGNGYDLIQDTAGAYPQYPGAAQLNGIDIIDGDGTDFLKQDSFDVPASGDLLLVGVFNFGTVDNANDSVLSLDGAANDFQLNADNASQFDGYFTPLGIGFGFALTGGPYSGWHIVAVVFDFTGAGTYEVFIDGVSVGSASYTTKLDAIQSLKVLANRNGTQPLAGGFAYLAASEAVDAATRQNYEGLSAWDWDLTSLLDAGHPYKSSPPTP